MITVVGEEHLLDNIGTIIRQSITAYKSELGIGVVFVFPLA